MYTVHLARRAFSKPECFHLSLCPSQYAGAVPYRDYANRADFAGALRHLGVLPENVDHIIDKIERDGSETLLNLYLSDDVAVYFGWATGN